MSIGRSVGLLIGLGPLVGLLDDMSSISRLVRTVGRYGYGGLLISLLGRLVFVSVIGRLVGTIGRSVGSIGRYAGTGSVVGINRHGYASDMCVRRTRRWLYDVPQASS